MPLRDGLWHLRNTRVLLAFATVVMVVVLLVFAGMHLKQGRIFPGVWVSGVYVGGMTLEDAEEALLYGWGRDVLLRLVDVDRYWVATPADLGMRLNSEQAIAAARAVGLAGIPFGWDVEPQIETDYLLAQTFLLDLVNDVNVAPANAAYSLENRQLTGIRGRVGKVLEVGQTMSVLTGNTAEVVRRRQLDLITRPLVPDVIDPAPHLEAVRDLVQQPFRWLAMILITTSHWFGKPRRRPSSPGSRWMNSG